MCEPKQQYGQKLLIHDKKNTTCMQSFVENYHPTDESQKSQTVYWLKWNMLIQYQKTLSAKSRWRIRSLKNTTKHKHQLRLPASDSNVRNEYESKWFYIHEKCLKSCLEAHKCHRTAEKIDLYTQSFEFQQILNQMIRNRRWRSAQPPSVRMSSISIMKENLSF